MSIRKILAIMGGLVLLSTFFACSFFDMNSPNQETITTEPMPAAMEEIHRIFLGLDISNLDVPIHAEQTARILYNIGFLDIEEVSTDVFFPFSVRVVRESGRVFQIQFSSAEGTPVAIIEGEWDDGSTIWTVCPWFYLL